MFCCGGGRLRGVSCPHFENKKPFLLLGTMVNNIFFQRNDGSTFMQIILCFQGKGRLVSWKIENKKKIRGGGEELGERKSYTSVKLISI